MNDNRTNTQDGFVSSYLLYLLAAVSDRASAQFHTHARAYGLRVPEWRVLACLMDEDGAMVTRLAHLSLLEQSRLTKIVDQMVARGLVSRRADAKDKRRVRVFLSDEGRKLATGLIDDARAHEENLLGRLSQSEAAALKPVLQKLLRSLDQTDG
ncbi:Transcriptional regulator, MarR family [Sulfitobacter noctilucicola]|uniref:DNA-binding MarR family transcriptional regulator n=1 Tax=Sulfitobacter noctilucicola TaxID=1342301 RepID=A0A7W6Q4D8_9RHOB|nr:Transcriptional regulator, MarR family [Sulfitobacter noctilucicola]MBB4174563.1 DNA-binding MarR family transcriptional regulator [Sulfitobacter noctilucicola]